MPPDSQFADGPDAFAVGTGGELRIAVFHPVKTPAQGTFNAKLKMPADPIAQTRKQMKVVGTVECILHRGARLCQQAIYRKNPHIANGNKLIDEGHTGVPYLRSEGDAELPRWPVPFQAKVEIEIPPIGGQIIRRAVSIVFSGKPVQYPQSYPVVDLVGPPLGDKPFVIDRIARTKQVRIHRGDSDHIPERISGFNILLGLNRTIR